MDKAASATASSVLKNANKIPESNFKEVCALVEEATFLVAQFGYARKPRSSSSVRSVRAALKSANRLIKLGEPGQVARLIQMAVDDASVNLSLQSSVGINAVKQLLENASVSISARPDEFFKSWGYPIPDGIPDTLVLFSVEEIRAAINSVECKLFSMYINPMTKN